MKRKPLRQKSLTKTTWKRAFRACERALIAAVNRRDQFCQMPGCGSTLTLQMDHAIVSRKHLSTFFDIRQMVLLCRNCHCLKTFKCFGTEVKVTEIVRAREGSNFLNEIVDKSRQLKKWTLQELEDMTKKFDEVAT